MFSAIIFVGIITLTAYIMINHMGLVESLDFGAGAYYYADIPNFARFTDRQVFQGGTPAWVIVGLFLLWGLVMYRFWVYLEQKHTKDSATDAKEA